MSEPLFTSIAVGARATLPLLANRRISNVNNKHILLAFSLFMVVLSAAACQNGSGDSLPTVAVFPSVQPTGLDETESAAAPSGVPTETPLFGIPVTDESGTQNAPVIPGFTPQATTDIASLSGTLDLAGVAVGDTISLVGTLTIDEGNRVLVTDTNGSRVVIEIPAEMTQTMVNQQVYVVGIVASTEGDVNLQLLTIQALVESSISIEDSLAGSELTPESTSDALPTIAADVRLGANLSALPAYDQLIGQIGGATLGDRQWISLSGNAGAGWSFGFYSVADNSVAIYNILPDGTLQNQLGIPPLEGTEVFPLDREVLTIDSDRVVELYTENGGDEDLETIVLVLQAIDAATIHWTVLDVEGQTIFTVDAASGDVIQ
jgi:hypothetical protein